MKLNSSVSPKLPAGVNGVVKSAVSNARTSLVHFGETTSIHGIQELLTTKSRLVRLVWCFAFLITGTEIIRESVMAIREYALVPIATQLVIGPRTGLFPIFLCPRRWMNRTRLDLLGADNETSLYILSTFSDLRPSLEQSAQNRSRNLRNFDIRRTASKFKSVSETYSTMEEFLTSISYDGDAIIKTEETGTAMFTCIPV